MIEGGIPVGYSIAGHSVLACICIGSNHVKIKMLAEILKNTEVQCNLPCD